MTNAIESLRQLRKENLDLRHELQTVREQLRAETTRADASGRSAREAWELRAGVVLKDWAVWSRQRERG